MVTSAAFAQDITVTGTVTDASTEETVIGASVQLKGSTTVYAMTDDLGGYSITVPSNGVLVVSFLGYKTVEIPVNGRTTIDVALEFEAEMLEDVVVVAYGTARKEATTGSVATVSGDVIGEAPVTSVDKMLTGKMAGVQVTASSGQPGASSQIRIRGISSINAGNDPLWVVDGIPVMTGNYSYFTNTGNAIASINPNDIESITVLKDAAAASIYGLRAANGVILVTTKSGQAGKTRFTARVKFGGSMLANDNHFRVLNGAELLELKRVSAINAGYNPDDPTSTYYYPNSILNNEMTNWLREFTKVGLMQEYEINAQAGTDKGRFYASLSYQKNDGIAYGIDFQKFQARVNSDYQLTKTLSIGTRVNLAYTDQDDSPMQSLYYSNPLWGGLLILPWTPFYDEDGNYNVNISENSNTNPLYTATHDDQWERQYRVQGTVYLQWEPVRGLVIKTNNSIEGTFGEGRRYWAPDPGASTGTLQTSNTYYLQMTTSNTISYTNNWGDHGFNVMAGQEAMMLTGKSYYAYAPTVDANIPYLNTSVASSDEVSYGESKETLLSFFARAEYDYASRYYINASLRGDGSSLFGANNRWGLFWSASASWNIHNESWMKGTSSWLNMLKLRASYGVNGNNAISAYRAYGVYASTAYNGVTGMLPSQPANENLSWEKNKTWNVGVDFAFLNNRLSGTVEFYDRITSDMLLSKRVPATSGFTSNFMNIGEIRNTGIEVQLEGEVIRTDDWSWSIGANLAWNKSKVINLGDNEFLSYSGDSRLRHIVGRSFYTFYLRDYYGVNPSNGEALWVAEDGSITNDYSKSRYIEAGSPEPKIFGGFNTVVSWKGLSLSAFFEYKWGNKVYLLENRYYTSDGNQMGTNQSIYALDYWKNPGDTGTNPRPVAGNTSESYSFGSDRWLEDGSYIRLKDITLSYNLPQNALEKIKLQGLKLYVSGLNLYTFHDVSYFDPERGTDGIGAGIYPMTKTIVGGIEITF